MSSCACRRWGPGTACEKPVNTENARELEAKMKAVMAEREVQQNFWKTVPAEKEACAKTNQCPVEKPAVEKEVKECPPQQIRFWN